MNLWGAAPLMAAAGAGTGSTPYRQISVFDYLGIPAMAALFITGSCLAVSAVLVHRHDQQRNHTYKSKRDWLDRPILGSGAWTANDSWATNISTGFVVVGTFIAATASPSGMFPNIALDRFAFATLAAGFFVAAAPVLFGILYSRFTAKNPGLTADATVNLPGLRVATIAVPSGATVTIATDTAIQDDTRKWAVLRAGGAYQIPQGAKIQVVAGAHKAAQLCVRAARDKIAAAPHASPAAIEAATEGLRLAIERALAKAVTGSEVPDGGPAARDIQRLVDSALSAESVRAATKQAVLAANTPAQAAIEQDVLARAAGVVNALAGKTVLAANVPAAQRGAPPPAAIPPEVLAEQVADIVSALTHTARQFARKYSQADLAEADPGGADPAGADPAGADLPEADPAEADLPEADPAEADLPEAVPKTYAAMAYAGAADIGVLPGSVVVLRGCAGQWTVAQADVLRPVPPSDTLFKHPVVIHADGGVKVTVTGAADVTLGKGAEIVAPRRKSYTLPKPRPFLAPQGTNLIVANLGIILAVNVLTMFGIGAELGIAGVLAAFSVADPLGKGWLFAALGVVAIFVIWYAATAARALADPQPGSSISAQAGTSFTL